VTAVARTRREDLVSAGHEARREHPPDMALEPGDELIPIEIPQRRRGLLARGRDGDQPGVIR
jgi:hypothetical protein